MKISLSDSLIKGCRSNYWKTPLALSNNKEFLATAAASNTNGNNIALWDRETEQLVRTFEGHQGYVYCIKFFQNDKYIISASRDNTGMIWDISTGKQLYILEGHTHSVLCVDVSPGNEYFATGSIDCACILWCLTQEEEQASSMTNNKVIQPSCTFQKHNDRVMCVAFTKDGKNIVTGSGDTTLKLLNIENKKVLHTYTGHKDYVLCVAISSDNKYMASGSCDKTGEILKILVFKFQKKY